jgi:hypothetical protein
VDKNTSTAIGDRVYFNLAILGMRGRENKIKVDEKLRNVDFAHFFLYNI